MASALATVASGLEPAEAARICGEAAQSLANALAKEENSGHRHSLAMALAEISVRLEPREAGEMLVTALAQENERICRRAVDEMLYRRSRRG